MATVTARGVAWTTTAGAKSVTSFTPTAGDLIVCVAGVAGVDTAPTISDNDSGITSWVLVDSFRSYGSAVSGGLRIYVAGQACSGSAMTVTMTPSGDTGGGLAVFSVSSPAGYGAGGVRSTGGQADIASGTPAPVLSNTPLSKNPCLIAVMTNTNGSANASPRTSPAYSEAYDQGFNTPPSGLEVQFVNSSETSATLTTGGAAASAFASIGVEFNTIAVLTRTAAITLTPDVVSAGYKIVERSASVTLTPAVASAATFETPAWSPSSIAGLECWLKADAIAQADNTNVTTWEDSHTSNKDATGATGQTLQTNEIQGLPIVRFDGTDDKLVLTGINNNVATRTFFAVVKVVAAVANDCWMGWSANTLWRNSATNYQFVFTQAATAVNIGANTVGSARIITTKFTSASSADIYYDDGAAQNFDPHDGYQAATGLQLTLGARDSSGNLPAQVDIGEVLIYDSALSDTDRETIYDYLADRWLPPVHERSAAIGITADVASAGAVEHVPYAAAVLGDGPLRYYKLGEPSGTAAVDRLAAQNLTYTNTPTLGVAGLLPSNATANGADTAVSFAFASSEFAISSTGTPNLQGADVSLEAWVNVASLPAGDATIAAIYNHASLASAGAVFAIRLNSLGVLYANGAVAAAKTIQTATTYHVIIALDASTDEVKMFVNGVQVGSTATYQVAGGLAFSPDRISVAAFSAFWTGYANATIDEVAVYGTTLSAAQARAHYVAAGGTVTHERSVSVTLTPVVASAQQNFTIVERSASVTLTPSVASAPQRVHQRSAAVTLTPAIASAGVGAAPAVYPVVASMSTGSNVASANSTVTVPYPTGIQSGDLLILVMRVSGTATTWNAITGWTQISYVSSTPGMGVAYRWADGTEGASFTTQTNQARAKMVRVYRITGADYMHTPEAAQASGTSTTPNPPSLDPSGWATEATLWIAACTSAATAYPTDYEDGSVESGDGTPGSLASATRDLSASSEDPGTFTIASSVAWRAATIAIRPAGPAETHERSASVTITADVASAGHEGGFIPSELPSLASWLQADAISGADGDPLTLWEGSGLSTTPVPVTVTNGTFETDIAGWGKTDANVSATHSHSTEQAHSGTGSLKLVNTAAGEDDYVDRAVTVTANEVYRVRAWVNTTVFTAAATGNRGIQLTSGGVGVGTATLAASTGGSWVQLTAIGFSTATSLFIRLYAPQGTTYWDDVTVERIPHSAAANIAPTLQTSEINGLPVVRFDGVDDVMSVGGITNNTAARTMFVVAKPLATPASGDGIVGFGSTSKLGMTSAGVFWYQNQAAASVTVRSGNPNGVTEIYAMRFNSTTSADGWAGATQISNFDPLDVYQSGVLPLVLAYGTGSLYANIDIAEVLVFDAALSDTDVTQVREWLTDKWIPAVTVHERSASVTITPAIASAQQNFSVVSRSAAITLTPAVASVPQRVRLRSAAVTITPSIASVQQNFSVLSRSAAVTITPAIASAPQRARLRSASVTITPAIISAQQNFSVLSRSATITLTPGIATVQRRVLLRATSVTIAPSLNATGQVGSGPVTQTRSVSVTITPGIASAASFYSILSRSAAITLTPGIASVPRRVRLRSAAITITPAIVSSGLKAQILSRSASVTITIGIASFGTGPITYVDYVSPLHLTLDSATRGLAVDLGVQRSLAVTESARSLAVSPLGHQLEVGTGNSLALQVNGSQRGLEIHGPTYVGYAGPLYLSVDSAQRSLTVQPLIYLLEVGAALRSLEVAASDRLLSIEGRERQLEVDEAAKLLEVDEVASRLLEVLS